MKKIVMCLFVVLLLPMNARAQQVNLSIEDLYRLYYSMEQIKQEVWINNPNPAAAARHAMLIMQNHGLGWVVNMDVWNVDTNPNPVECDSYFGWWDEEGNYHEECSPWSTYNERCYTLAQIQSHDQLGVRAYWVGVVFTSGGILVGMFGNPIIGGMMALMGQTFEGWYWGIEREVQRRRELQCP